MQLETRSFAMAAALISGFGTLFATFWMIMFGGPPDGTIWLSYIYRGYEISVQGAAIGLIWGFFDGLVCGGLLSWLYNRFAARTTPARSHAMHLNVKSFALASGLLWGAWVMLSTWWIVVLDGKIEAPVWLSYLYRGYSVTWLGGVIGFVWAFIGGFIGGAALAWFYNRLVGTEGPDPNADPDTEL